MVGVFGGGVGERNLLLFWLLGGKRTQTELLDRAFVIGK